MRKSILLSALVMLFFSLHVIGQIERRTTIVKQSVLTGLDLPRGTTRCLSGDSLTLAKNLLQQRITSLKGRVNNVEILNVPADSMIARLTKGGWQITPDPDDKNFYYITRGNKNLIVYSMQGQSGPMYFGELDKALRPKPR